MGIHDIYISFNLKHFHGNRIAVSEPRIPFPFSAPFSLLVFRFAVSPSRLAVPMGRKDCVHDRAADRTHDRAFDHLVPFVPSPVPCLSPLFSSRPSHPFISSPAFVPFLSPPYRQAGRGGVPSPTVSPFPDRCLVSSDVVGCGDIPMDVA